MEDVGPTIIESLERAGFTVLQRYDECGAEWTVTATRDEDHYIARGPSPIEAVVDIAAMAGWTTLRE